MRLFYFIFLGLLMVIPTVAVAQLSGRASVIDGDTLEIHSQRIRLFGIDAPEGRQTCDREGKAWRCGQRAALALADKIGRRPIECQERDRDRYRRIVAICYLNGEDLNGWMVSQGWALDYRQYSKGRYAAEEADARGARRGIWSSKFAKPWDWRSKKRKSSKTKRSKGTMPVSASSPSIAESPHAFFQNLKRPSSPNNWLIAPKGFPGTPDEIAPVFPVSAEKLNAALERLIKETKNTSGLRRDGTLTCYVAETSVFHFRDDVCVQVLAMGDNSSTIAAYSASRVGYWDLGTNKRRLKAMVSILRANQR